MMSATFSGNPHPITIITCYCLTNVGDETDIMTFYKKLSSLVRNIPKHNVMIIGEDINAHIGKNENDKFW